MFNTSKMFYSKAVSEIGRVEGDSGRCRQRKEQEFLFFNHFDTRAHSDRNNTHM